MGVDDAARDELAGRSRPLSEQSYRVSRKAVIGIVLWLVVLAWGFSTRSGYVLIILALLTWFGLMTAVLTSILAWMGRDFADQRARRSVSVRSALIVVLPVAVAALVALGQVVAAGDTPTGRAALGAPPRAFDDMVYAWRGIRMTLADPVPIGRAVHPDEAGMVVQQIEPGSPAAASGLLPGDIITGLDGMPVGTVRGLALVIADRPTRPIIHLRVWHDHRRQLVAMSLAAPPVRAFAARRLQPDGMG
jgi:membrane-associated protease RseP (regulator of RpoE activity)